MSSAICSNLDKSKNLSSGNGLKQNVNNFDYPDYLGPSLVTLPLNKKHDDTLQTTEHFCKLTS